MSQKGRHSRGAIALLGMAVLVSWTGAVDASVIGLDELALYGGTAVILDKNIKVTGPIAAGEKGFYAGRDASLQDVYSAGAVLFGKDTTVDGNVYANGGGGAGKNFSLTGDFNSGKAVIIDSGANILGDVTAKGDIWFGKESSVAGNTTSKSLDVDLWEGLAFPEAPDGNPGGDTLWLPKNSEKGIEPGRYGGWSISAGSAVTLTAGVYDIEDVWIAKESKINLDTTDGDIVLNVFGKFSTGTKVAFNWLDEDHDVLINVIDHDMILGTYNQLDAHVTVYGGSFGALAYGSLGGTFLASESAWLGKETGVEFRPYAVQVPEPGTLGVLALGGMIVASVTRRRP